MIERIFGGLLALFGAILVWDGWRLGREARPDGMFDDLGPDRYMMLLGGLLLAAGITIAVQAKGGAVTWRRPVLWPLSSPVVFTLVMAGYALLTPLLGYTLATFLFFVAAFQLAHPRRWPVTVGISAAATAISYVLFVQLSDMPLPRGLVGI